jgi:hypothetical protein
VGHPCIVALDRDHCAVADGSGHVTAIDLRTREVGPRLFVGAGGEVAYHFRTLRRHPARPGVVAVATRGGHAAVVDLDVLGVTKIHPAQGGTVNAVAFAPDGRSLAIGTGGYPLMGASQPAIVEIWTLANGDPPQFAGFAALPGTCVDAIAWSPDGARIACATGLRSQKSGFLAQLEADVLRARSFFEVPWSGSGRLCYVEDAAPSGRLAVVFKGGFRMLDAGDGREAWRFDRPAAPDDFLDFDVDPQGRRIILSSGVVLDAADGAETSHFLPMKDCTSIAVRPDGGFIGASTRGRIYCWD